MTDGTVKWTKSTKGGKPHTPNMKSTKKRREERDRERAIEASQPSESDLELEWVFQQHTWGIPYGTWAYQILVIDRKTYAWSIFFSLMFSFFGVGCISGNMILLAMTIVAPVIFIWLFYKCVPDAMDTGTIDEWQRHNLRYKYRKGVFNRPQNYPRKNVNKNTQYTGTKDGKSKIKIHELKELTKGEKIFGGIIIFLLIIAEYAFFFYLIGEDDKKKEEAKQTTFVSNQNTFVSNQAAIVSDIPSELRDSVNSFVRNVNAYYTEWQQWEPGSKSIDGVSFGMIEHFIPKGRAILHTKKWIESNKNELKGQYLNMYNASSEKFQNFDVSYFDN